MERPATSDSLTPMYVLLGVGVVALSTAVIFVKLSELPPSFLASARLLVGAAVMSPWLIAERRRTGAKMPIKALVPAALLLAVHFITWFIGVRMTSAANATLVVNLSPVAMPFALYLMVGERVTQREIVGSAIAVAGVIVLALGSAQFDKQTLLGDLICIGSMIFAVGYLAFAKRAQHTRADGPLPMFTYLVPLYTIAGITTTAFGVALGEVGEMRSTDLDIGRELLLVAALAIIPTAIGHSILNLAMVKLRGQVVAVTSLGQVIFATLLAIPLLGEIPEPTFYPSCVLVGIGAVVVVLKPRRSLRK